MFAKENVKFLYIIIRISYLIPLGDDILEKGVVKVISLLTNIMVLTLTSISY